MSDKPSNNLDQPQEVSSETPEARAKIEAALENQDLKRLVVILIENQNNPAFLEKVRNFTEGELQKEHKQPDPMNTKLKFDSRQKFIEAIKLQVLRNPNCLIDTKDSAIRSIQLSEIQPIQLSDDLFRLIHESGNIIFSPRDCRVWQMSKGLVALQKSDGTLIDMHIESGDLNGDFTYSLIYRDSDSK